MKESIPLQDFEKNVPEFMRAELDAIAELVVRNEHNNLTRAEKITLSHKKARYVAYIGYITKQVDHLKVKEKHA